MIVLPYQRSNENKAIYQKSIFARMKLKRLEVEKDHLWIM